VINKPAQTASEAKTLPKEPLCPRLDWAVSTTVTGFSTLAGSSDLSVLIAVGATGTVIGSATVIWWTRVVRHGWPDLAVIFSTPIGLLGITFLSVLTYLILEHCVRIGVDHFGSQSGCAPVRAQQQRA
jgi:hypothetical protein